MAGKTYFVYTSISFNIDINELVLQENALIANENWEDYANLLGFIHHVRVNVKEKIQFKLEQNVGKDQGESVEARSGTHKRNVSGLTNGKGYADSKMALKVTDAILLRDGRPLSEILNSLQTTDHFLLTLSNADFLLHMERFMGICLEADSTLSLRAAGILVKEFSGMCSVTEDQIKTISWKKKFRTYVIKDKWLLAAQVSVLSLLYATILLSELVDN